MYMHTNMAFGAAKSVPVIEVFIVMVSKQDRLHYYTVSKCTNIQYL